MSKIVIIESSLNKRSKSERLAKEAYTHLNKEEATLISLGEYNLPLCDGGSVYADPNVQKLTQELESAKGVLKIFIVLNNPKLSSFSGGLGNIFLSSFVDLSLYSS